MFFSLENKVAVITGGTKGIGLATARRFAKAGAKVVISGMSDGTETAKELGGLFIKADVSKEDQVKNLMEKAAEHYGNIDIIINNAGIFLDGEVFSLEADAKNYIRMFEVNTMGAFYGMKHGAPQMKNGGSIVNIASNSGPNGFATAAGYGMSKMGVIGLTKAASVELALMNIRVNSISPGSTDTEGMGMTDNHYLNIVTQRGKIAQPEEIAAILHFLAADDCQYITGENIMVDGGANVGPSVALYEAVQGTAPTE